SVGTVVDHEAVTAFLQAQFVRNFGGLQQQVAEDLMVFRRGFGKARDGLLGNNQHVRRRLRFDVAEREHQIVFINNGRRNFAGDDFFKKRFAHNCSFRRAELRYARIKKFGARSARPSGNRSFHHQRAFGLLRFGGEAAAEVFDDVILQLFATDTPASRAGELLDAAAQSAKAQNARRLAELGAKFVAQAREKEKFEAVGGFAREQAKVGFDNFPRAAFQRAGADDKAKLAQNFFQCAGKFADGDRFAFQFGFEIVEDGRGGVAQHFRVEQTLGVAGEFDGNHFHRAWDAFAAGKLEDQAAGLERDHCL